MGRILPILKLFIMRTKSPEVIMQALKMYYEHEGRRNNPFEIEKENEEVTKSRCRCLRYQSS